MNKKNNISPIIIFLTLLIPLFFYSTVRIASLEGCENCFDVYYHVGIADLGPSYFCADKLPAMSMSLWAEKFSDKELGFHFILSALRTLRNFIFLESNPPFHFSILFFAIALCSFFTFLIFKFKIRHPLIISTLFPSLKRNCDENLKRQKKHCCIIFPHAVQIAEIFDISVINCIYC